jgi:hypothetical protein
MLRQCDWYQVVYPELGVLRVVTGHFTLFGGYIRSGLLSRLGHSLAPLSLQQPFGCCTGLSNTPQGVYRL